MKEEVGILKCTEAKECRPVWQQELHRPLEGHANAIVNVVLPRSSVLSRYSGLLLAFFISGYLHYLCDLGFGVRSDESGAVLFFCLQALGILIEEAVQTVPGVPSFARKIIGHVWVVVFMSWSAPVWFYQHMRTDMDPAGILPVHFVSPLMQAWSSK